MNRILIILILIPTYVMSSDSYFYVGGKTTFISNLDEKQENLGYGAIVGYKWNQFLSMSVDYTDLGTFYSAYDSNKYINTDVIITYPISNFSNVNLGVGGAWDITDNENSVPTTKFGIDYKITDNIIFFGDYKYYINKKINSLALELGVRYNFKGKPAQKSKLVYEKPKEIKKVEKVEPKKVILPKEEKEPEKVTITKVEEQPVKEKEEKIITPCKLYTTVSYYTVMPGDHLYKISRAFNISFKLFKALNPKFFTGRNPDLIHPGELIKLNILEDKYIKTCYIPD